MNDKLCRRVWAAIGNVGSSMGHYYDYCAVTVVNEKDVKQNYSVKQWLSKAGDCVAVLKKIPGVKYVQSHYGYIRFQFDDTQLKIDIQREEQEAKARREAKLNAVDLKPYIPTQKVIEKLTGYFLKGSRVNCAAIKDTKKWLTYYYAAYMLDWGDLRCWLTDADSGRWSWTDDDGVDFDTVCDAIDFRVKPVVSFKRTKSEERLLNLSKKVYQAVKDSGLSFDIAMVPTTLDECWKDGKNGCAYTVAYELTVGTEKVRFSDVTNEGGGSFGYQFHPCGYLLNKGDFEDRLLASLKLA